MATTINPAAVVAAFGAYYIDAGQNEGNIHKRLRETFGTKEAFTVVDTEDTILRESNTEFSEVIQGFQKTFTPKGGVIHTPKEIKLYNVKVDQLFTPDDLKNSWLAFVTSNKLDRTEWPYVRWFIEEYVMGQIQADIEKEMIYKGVYAAPTPGTANAAIDTMNGIKKLINDAITGTTTTPIVTGAPNADNVLFAGQVESFSKGIPELYQNLAMPINMNRGLAQRYKEGRRVKYNSNYAQVTDKMAVQDFEENKVTGRASMAGSTKIWATPKNNAILAFKGGSNQTIVEVEKVDRQVKVYTDFWIGAGFIDDGLVFTNDVELV